MVWLYTNSQFRLCFALVLKNCKLLCNDFPVFYYELIIIIIITTSLHHYRISK